MTEFPETVSDASDTPPPVRISGDANRTLASALRRWSGWSRAEVHFAEPPGNSPWASTNMTKRAFYINADLLTRNPNRVLRKVTPFRMRQEAFLTGAMLHEAGHARHSHWRPIKPEHNVKFKHGQYSIDHEGEEINKPTLDLAAVCEEPRVEALMVRDEGKIGALGLGWTMRAMAAYCYPMTTLSDDPDKAIMQVVSSYSVRAGRLIALDHHATGDTGPLPSWVNEFQEMLHGAITEHLVSKGIDEWEARSTSSQILGILHEMYTCTDDIGTFMPDKAREVLDLLYPDSEPDECPLAGGGCGAVGEPLPQHPLDDGEGEGQDDGEQDSEQSGGGSVSEGSDTDGPLAKALAAIEGAAESSETREAQVMAGQAPPEAQPDEMTGERSSTGASSAKYAHTDEGRWRTPTPAERAIKANAERFLRGMIDPTITRTIRTTAQPSSDIDAAAYAAWKANGQRGEPAFFRRVKRTVSSSPPIKIAVLRDVSGSMQVLTKPSALLAWSIAAAAFDLRNFAGRGVQIESCFINWGSDARVIQHNGEMMRGVFESRCDESTSALLEASELVEQEIPGFFDAPEDGLPQSRLIVHFTDWMLGNLDGIGIQAQGLMNGVNMLSVLPRAGFAPHLRNVLDASPGRVGRCEVMHYDPKDPGSVWTRATQMLQFPETTGENG